MRRAIALAAVASAKIYFKETFDKHWQDRWVVSDWKKAGGQDGEFKLTAGDYFGDAEADKGIQTSQDARFYDVSAKFPEFSNKGEDLVIQFSVKHTQNLDCGGGYVKVFPAGLDQEHMSGDSDYNIMFGPDVCGHTKKVHVIFANKGKNHLIKKEITCETDQLTHVYTLIVHPDNTYEVRIDGNKKESGSLADDWDILPPKKIKDPSQSKPSDWVDSPKMADPSDVKPDGYDDIPKQIVDPEASKPEDWDTDADGEWEAPMIANPDYKGPWKVKQIDNPDYKGPWVHPEIDNPDYVADDTLYSYESFGAIGIDIWQVKSGSIFDNILITNSVNEAESFLADTYSKNKDAEKTAFDNAEKKRTDSEEAARKSAEEERKKSAAEDENEDEEKPKVDL
jgi:calreticulin